MNYRFNIETVKKCLGMRILSTFHRKSGFYQNYGSFMEFVVTIGAHPEGVKKVLEDVELRYGVPIIPVDKKTYKTIKNRKSKGKYSEISLFPDSHGGFVLPVHKYEANDELINTIEDYYKRYKAIEKSREEAKDAIQELESAQSPLDESGDAISGGQDVPCEVSGNGSD